MSIKRQNVPTPPANMAKAAKHPRIGAPKGHGRQNIPTLADEFASKRESILIFGAKTFIKAQASLYLGPKWSYQGKRAQTGCRNGHNGQKNSHIFGEKCIQGEKHPQIWGKTGQKTQRVPQFGAKRVKRGKACLSFAAKWTIKGKACPDLEQKRSSKENHRHIWYKNGHKGQNQTNICCGIGQKRGRGHKWGGLVPWERALPAPGDGAELPAPFLSPPAPP